MRQRVAVFKPIHDMPHVLRFTPATKGLTMKKSESPHKPSVDFDLRQLEIFRKVVEQESFSKAAEAVFLSQASVSERIATLENQVGAKLLDRLGRRVVPTVLGKRLYKHTLMLLEVKETAVQDIQDFLGQKKGGIHLGGSTIPGEYIIPKMLGRFRAKYPLISVTLSIAHSEQIEKMVLDGHLELGIIGSKSTHANFLQYDLWKDELVLALPPNHRWAGKGAVSVDDLYGEPFIMRPAGSGTRKALMKHLERLKPGFEPLNIVACLGSSTAVKEGVKAGLGISILSSRAMDTELKTGMLKALSLKGLSMLRHFHLIRDKRRIASPLCQAMVDFLRSTAEEGTRADAGGG